MASRFTGPRPLDYKSTAVQHALRTKFVEIEQVFATHLSPSIEQSMALDYLGFAYEWVCKAIQHDQLIRTQGGTNEPTSPSNN
jgi:hypothetical protein